MEEAVTAEYWAATPHNGSSLHPRRTQPPDTTTNIIHQADGIKLIRCLMAETVGRATG